MSAELDQTINLTALRELVSNKEPFKIKVIGEDSNLVIVVQYLGGEAVFVTTRGNVRYYKSPGSLLEFLYRERIYKSSFNLEFWNPDNYYNASGSYHQKEG